jgi:hypothetical protein
MKTNKTFVCPVCGGTVNRGAHACPHCGADERTGWSDQTYLDGIDLGEDIDYDEMVENEFPSQHPRRQKPVRWTVIVAAILLLLSLAGLLRIIL